jgi:integrase
MSKARAAGEGSVYRRKDGRWVAQVTTWEGGKRRQHATYHKSQKAAREKLTADTSAKDKGAPIPGVRLTVRDFLASWVQGLEGAGDLRPESLRRYRDTVNLHLVPELGRKSLAKLTPEDVRGCYARLREKGLSGTSVSLAHGVLHTALQQAMSDGKVARNVTDRAFVKAPKRSTAEMRTLTPTEATRLLEAAQSDALEAFYVLAVTTGMRLGELQALKWREVDLDRGTAQVVATLYVEGGVIDFAPPKTDKSRRTVTLSKMAIASLRRHRTRQLEQRLAAGPLWEDHGLVFTTSHGRPLDGNNLRTRSFARLLQRAGLPPMRFHELRHTAATLLMAEGVPVKVAAEVLGHSDVKTTLAIYSHVLPDMQGAAADAMDRVFQGVAMER